MTDEENTFSFATDTGSEAPASEPAIRAAHMAPAEPEPAIASVPEVLPVREPIGAHAEPAPVASSVVDAQPEPIGAHAAPAVPEMDEPAAAPAEVPEVLPETSPVSVTADDPMLAVALHILNQDESEPKSAAAATVTAAAVDEPVLAHMAEMPAADNAAPSEVGSELESAPTDAAVQSIELDTVTETEAASAVPAAIEELETDSVPAAPLPTASLDDTAEIDVEEVETRLKDPGSTQSFEPITEERIDTGSTYDAGTTTTLMWGARSDVGCVRPHNEDSYLVQSPLFCVCDGMGGHAAGEVASSIAVETIAKTAPSAADAAQLAAAVEAANAAVIEAAVNGLGKPGMGCTATCAYLEGNTIAIAHVGDSRAYLLHEGTLIRVTRDHSYVEELVDAGEITADEARVHPNRSVITRALGSDPAMYADHFCLNIEEGDRLILCSDGLSSMVPDGEIENIASKSSTAQICVDNLVDAALAAGGHDNVTVVVVDVVDDGRIKELLGRRRRNLIIAICAVVAALVIAAVVVGVGISRSVFLGVNESDETVAIYTGVRAELFGCKLYQIEDTTSVKVYDLPDDTRSRLEEGIAQDSIEQARDTVSGYRSQIDADEAKQVENAEAIRKSTEEDAAGDDSAAGDADSDTATATDKNTQGGA